MRRGSSPHARTIFLAGYSVCPAIYCINFLLQRFVFLPQRKNVGIENWFSQCPHLLHFHPFFNSVQDRSRFSRQFKELCACEFPGSAVQLLMMGAHLTACFEREKELSRATGFPNLWELNKNPKSLNGAASTAGIVSLGAEAAGRGGARPRDIQLYVDALRGLCGCMGIAPYPYTVHEGDFLPAHTQKFEHSGLFLSSRELGCVLNQGDKIGVLCDPQCEEPETLTAACDGILWGIRRHAAVYAGEVAYILAKKSV